MPDLLEPLGYAFVLRALAAAAVVAIVCATVGVFVVLRGLAFLGDAIAHTAFPGVVIAYLLKVDLIIGGAVAAILGALAMSGIGRRGVLREDTAIGVVFSGMFAFGIVLFSGIRAYTGDLLGVLLGNVLGVSETQLLIAAGATAVIVLALVLLWRSLVFVTFDPTGAAAAGIRVTLYDALLMTLVALAIAVSIQLVGVVLVVAMLVTPAASARLLAGTMRGMLTLSLLFALLAGLIGIYASFYANTAAGATIVLAATAIFGLAWIVRVARLRLIPA